MRAWIAALAVLLAAPATAAAETYCVNARTAGCQERATAAAAFAAAAGRAGPDAIVLGPLREAGDFADAPGEPVRVRGAGRGATVLTGTLDLVSSDSSAVALAVAAAAEPDGSVLLLAGPAVDVRVDGGVRLRDGAALLSSAVAGPVVAAGATRMESVEVRGGPVEVTSGRLAARHLTVTGALEAGDGAAANVASSILLGGVEGDAAVAHSHLAGDPAFAAPPADLRLRADSPLVDAGDPAPLAAGEPQEDAGGSVRAVDGDGDGTARRDVGAHERPPPAPPATAGNRLRNPGAEEGSAAEDAGAGPAPPGWRRTGGFTSVRYGAVAGAVPFPPRSAADMLGAGRAFFAGGPAGAATLTQVVDVSRSAPEIDRRAGRVRLSALLGGYRASPDHAVVAAEFRGPGGRRLGALTLDTVTPAERAHATMLAARAAERRIPRLTRTIAVSLRAGPPGGRYNDAYVDDVALIPALPAPPSGRPRGRPFAGLVVVARRAPIGRGGRARARLACPSRTVQRCRGTVTLTTRRGKFLGGRRVSLRRGRARRVAVPLRRRARRARLHTAARDGQGLVRTAVAPVRIVSRSRSRGPSRSRDRDRARGHGPSRDTRRRAPRAP